MHTDKIRVRKNSFLRIKKMSTDSNVCSSKIPLKETQGWEEFCLHTFSICSLHLQWFQPISWYPLHLPLHCLRDIHYILHCTVSMISTATSIALSPWYPLHPLLHCPHDICCILHCTVSNDVVVGQGVTSKAAQAREANQCSRRRKSSLPGWESMPVWMQDH